MYAYLNFTLFCIFRTCTISKETARSITNVLESTLQKNNTRISELSNEVKDFKGQLNKKMGEFEVCSKQNNKLDSRVAELSKKIDEVDDTMQEKIMENNKLQTAIQNLKDQLYRAQHINTDLNSCVSCD